MLIQPAQLKLVRHELRTASTAQRDRAAALGTAVHDAAASGPVEHRDVVLGRREREHKVILCCSRMVDEGAVLCIDL